MSSPMKEEWDNGIVMRFLRMLKRNWKVLLGIIVGMGALSLVMNYFLGL